MTRLQSATNALEHQKKWFAELRERVAAGSPLALVNADAPQEILRAMDIPYVVNQWWASVIGAKQQAEPSLAQLRALGYPDYSRQYDALAIGAMSLPEADAPWGGLPRPSIVVAENSGDSTRKVFELWTEDPSTAFFSYERTAAVPAPSRWWELVPREWESVFGSDRIDLMAAENRLLIEFLEQRTGRTFDIDKLAAVMHLINEHAEWNRKTRDLVAATRPAPVRVNDTIPAVMIPQWHRGSEWGRDAARSLYEEVSTLVETGQAVAPHERIRLMWIGRGLWNDLALYQRFEEQFGAVFVWSMYLAIAADGYVRYGDDPIRALAARFAGITDLLYAPPLGYEWYVKEALGHGVDGVVHLVADDVPGSAFTTQALRDAGIPVLEIHANNADPRSIEASAIGSRMESFIGGLATGAL